MLIGRPNVAGRDSHVPPESPFILPSREFWAFLAAGSAHLPSQRIARPGSETLDEQGRHLR
jgi:hypothetical protein